MKISISGQIFDLTVYTFEPKTESRLMEMMEERDYEEVEEFVRDSQGLYEEVYLEA